MLANSLQSSLRRSLSRYGTRIISRIRMDLAGPSTEKTQAKRNRVCRSACFPAVAVMGKVSILAELLGTAPPEAQVKPNEGSTWPCVQRLL